jgi:hypothetical protein
MLNKLIPSFKNTSEYNLGKKQQRYVLENVNDLILLLSESLKNMENSFGGSGSASKPSKKNKPKKGEPSLSEMRKSQESLKSQLERMISDSKQGNKKGSKPGSGELGKMLAQQEIFQKLLNELRGSQQSGSQITQKIDEINQMLEQNKRDIINFNINNQTLMRQKQIVTRLLEAEKAEQERELDDKRESNEALDYSISKNNLKFERDDEFVNFEEIFIKSSVQLNGFFKSKYQSYISNLKHLPNEKGN